jgi:FMN phosphatase YigB (HAD superfamily)
MSQPSLESTSLDIKALSDVILRQMTSAKVLSLDCFDTLLWRTVSDPIEVFRDLQNHPLFIEHGINWESRRLAERKIRQVKAGMESLHEITIEEIYQQLLPSADSALVEQFVRAEIEAEKKYLFAYEPMFALLEQAKKKGLKTVIVSDMYIHAHQLQELVEACAERAGLKTNIDYYFTSADHRTTKGRDLFSVVAKIIGEEPQFIVHTGDNPHADLDGAVRSGVKGFHFNRFSAALEDCMRKNAQLQKLLINDHGETQPIAMSWHAIWSQLPRTNNTLEMLGWYYLGPILLHYSHWLQEQLQILLDAGEKPRLIFMMRDGFLPYQCYQEMQSQGLVVRGVPCVTIDVSRFATMAINLDTKEKVKQYLVTNKDKIYRVEMLRQLMGNYDISILETLIDTDETIPWEDFCNNVLSNESLNIITAASSCNRLNFLKYIKNKVQPRPGETLVLADLGYSGTIQDQIRDVFSDAFDVRVEGRYLILRESDRQQKNKIGLIDYRSLNFSSINLLLSQIQTLEQLTVNDNGSLMRYDEHGHPIHESPLLTDRQRQLKQLVQTAAMDFIRTQGQRFFRFAKKYKPSAQEAVGLIGRFTLQPRASEIDLYREFTHDINNGTQRMRWISNPKLSRQLLIRGGAVSYDCDRDKMLANDLNSFSPSSSYFNFVKARLGLKFGWMDYRVSGSDIPCVVNRGEVFQDATLPCFYTHDGFKVGLLQNLHGCTAVGISFGLQMQWLQIHSIALVSWLQFASTPNWQPTADLLPTTRIEGGRTYEEGLVQFHDREGFVYIDLKSTFNTPIDDNVLVVVFRDIATRDPSDTEANKINSRHDILQRRVNAKVE